MIGIEKLFKIDQITIAKPRASIKGFAFFHMFLNPFLKVFASRSIFQFVVFENILNICFKCEQLWYKTSACEMGLEKKV